MLDPQYQSVKTDRTEQASMHAWHMEATRGQACRHTLQEQLTENPQPQDTTKQWPLGHAGKYPDKRTFP